MVKYKKKSNERHDCYNSFIENLWLVKISKDNNNFYFLEELILPGEEPLLKSRKYKDGTVLSTPLVTIFFFIRKEEKRC